MKLFRAYIITVIVCISVSSILACIFIADENARKISLGENYSVVTAEELDPLLQRIKKAAESMLTA